MPVDILWSFMSKILVIQDVEVGRSDVSNLSVMLSDGINLVVCEQ